MDAINQLAQIRVLLERLASGLTEEELFTTPEGFANNIAWNVGHVIVTQQILHYRLSGLETRIPNELVDAYKKGTGPDSVNPESYRALVQYMHQTPESLRHDYENNAFASFNTYETSTGIVLHNIDEAIFYNNLHEATHLGYIMAMKRAIAVQTA